MTTEEAAKELMSRVDQDGVGVITVDDGTILAFTTATLQSLLDASQTSGKALIFVQRHVPSKNVA